LPWQLTVGQLRAAVAQVPDEVVVSLALPPSTPRHDLLTLFLSVEVAYAGGRLLQLKPVNSPTPLLSDSDDGQASVTDGQVTIAASGNVLVPAVLALEAQGFTVTCAHADSGGLWTATREDTSATGSNPLEVLGLVALLRSRGKQWRASDPEIADVMERFDLG
jgi:hypothetical protein